MKGCLICVYGDGGMVGCFCSVGVIDWVGKWALWGGGEEIV